MNELITKDDERIESLFKALDTIQDKVISLKRHYRPILNGERYLSDAELSERLRISRRTLQEYRNAGRIPYFQLGGKILYRESEIEKLLEHNHINNSE